MKAEMVEGGLQERRALRRIAATLLALAAFAERAAGRSLPVRLLVLAILWRGEAIARAFIARTAEADGQGEDWAAFEAELPIRSSVADAEILALRLRMLSAALGMLAAAPDDCAAGFAALHARFGREGSASGDSALCRLCRLGGLLSRIRPRSRDRPPEAPGVRAFVAFPPCGSSGLA